MLTRLKESFARLFDVMAGGLHMIGLGPMAATLLGLAAAIVSSILYYLTQYQPQLLPWAAVLLLVSGFFDAADGAIARLFDEVSQFGGFVDSVTDRISEFLVLSAIILGHLCDLKWGMWAIAGSFLVSYARSRGETEGVNMKVGIAERPERLLILIFATLLGLVESGVIIVAVLATLTLSQRIAHVYHQLGSGSPSSKLGTASR